MTFAQYIFASLYLTVACLAGAWSAMTFTSYVVACTVAYTWPVALPAIWVARKIEQYRGSNGR